MIAATPPPKRSLWTRLCAAVLAALAVALLLSVGARTATTGGPPRDATTLLVKFVSPGHEAGAIAAEGDKHLGDTATRTAIVKIGHGESVDKKIADYSSRSDVLYAESNFIAQATLAAPNDPSFGSQYGFTKIQAVAGWSTYPGSYTSSGGATLAIVDTGVQANHPDLAGRVDTASAATCLTGVCVASTADDDDGHGTHVAGIAAASTNNGVGVAGTAFSSTILPVKVLDSTGSGTYASITSGILWAASHGARVMNLSLGGAGFSQTLCDAVATAQNTYGALVVAAAGNSNSSAPSYPAACPGAVGVAATDANDAKASFSNFGKPNVFVSAPGVSIFSTYFGSAYATLSGTSMATPFVTGLAALLVGQDSTRTPAALKLILAQTSDKVGSGYLADPYGTCAGCTWSTKFGYGRINAFRALNAATSDFTLSATPASRTIFQGATTTYTLAIASLGGFAGPVSLGASGLPSGATATFSPNPATSTTSKLTVTTTTSTAVGTFPITITGTSGSLSHSVPVTLVVKSSAPDFTLTAKPATLTVKVGTSGSYAITIGKVNAFAGSVDLSVSGLPAGTSAAFSTNPATSSSSLTISPSLTATRGTFTLTITGVSGSLTHSATVTLKLTGNYALSATPASQSVTAGSSTAYTVNIARFGYGTLVSLSASGLPAGAAASFSPSPANASSTMTVTTSASTPPGSYTLTITGSAGTVPVVNTTTVTLVVS